jgi:hypothetical protein
MVGTPQCLYVYKSSFCLIHPFTADMYVLHKVVLALFVLEEAVKLQINIPFAHTIDFVQPDDLSKS